MKLLKIADGYIAVNEMLAERWPYALAHALVLAKKYLQPHIDFLSGEELALMREFGQTDDDGNVIMSAPTTFEVREGSSAQAYNARHRELLEMGITPDWPVQTVVPPAEIKGEWLLRLEGIIEFEG